METERLAEWIQKAGKKEKISEFQYPFADDVYVELAYASKFVFQQIREVAREMFTNPRTRQQEERLNEDKLRTEYAKHVVKGWRGLTVKKLKIMIPCFGPEGEFTEETEIPFSIAVSRAIMEVSIDFESWILDTASNVQNFAHVAERKKEQLENLV